MLNDIKVLLLVALSTKVKKIKPSTTSRLFGSTTGMMRLEPSCALPG